MINNPEYNVIIKEVSQYDSDIIYDSLPDNLFDVIRPADKVVLKPNWISQSHQYRPDDWEYVITHPDIITAVLRKALRKIEKDGEISILDAPETGSSMNEILKHYPLDLWRDLAAKQNTRLNIIDLRDHEWISDGKVIIDRKKLPGDPGGKTRVNLIREQSEFFTNQKSKQGYYGADYNIEETNKAHDGQQNIYSISRTVIESDVFINLPKLKTHKKSGITCCLKNLVGINTYKNYLPHHTIGLPSHHGDQFPDPSFKHKLESKILPLVKQYFLRNKNIARILSPLFPVSEKVFGKTKNVVRSGNWYGNDTIWRMILDLNKILFYVNPDGSLRENILSNRKKYIGIVDAIVGGQGNGPKAPDPVNLGYLLCGNNPVAIDTVAASLMGFDPLKIPSLQHAFNIKNFGFVDFGSEQIEMNINNTHYKIKEIPPEFIIQCLPHFGWKGHIENNPGL